MLKICVCVKLSFYITKGVGDCYLTPMQKVFRLIFNAMMMRSTLFETNTLSLDLYSASSLIQQSEGRHVAPLGHIFLIPSQPVFDRTP